jgi:hypothetical protein
LCSRRLALVLSLRSIDRIGCTLTEGSLLV